MKRIGNEVFNFSRNEFKSVESFGTSAELFVFHDTNEYVSYLKEMGVRQGIIRKYEVRVYD